MSKELNQEQLAALRDYAEFVGENWKEALTFDWMGSGPTVSLWRGEWAYMQQIRNNFGPSWLAKFELPVQEPNFRDIYRNAVR